MTLIQSDNSESKKENAKKKPGGAATARNVFLLYTMDCGCVSESEKKIFIGRRHSIIAVKEDGVDCSMNNPGNVSSHAFFRRKFYRERNHSKGSPSFVYDSVRRKDAALQYGRIPPDDILPWGAARSWRILLLEVIDYGAPVRRNQSSWV